ARRSTRDLGMNRRRSSTAYYEGPPKEPHHPAASREVDSRSRAEPSPLGVLAEAKPTSTSVGVYVHVPFCTRRCEYCSFNTAPMEDRAGVTRFVHTVGREIGIVAGGPWAGDLPVGSGVFGGGAPSLLEASEAAGDPPA